LPEKSGQKVDFRWIDLKSSLTLFFEKSSLTLLFIMAERNRTRRNTLERRCLPKTVKRMFVGAPKGIFKMLEKVKKA
jgi:hypothetical protein